MKRVSSQPIIKNEANDDEEGEEEEEEEKNGFFATRKLIQNSIDKLDPRFHCITLHSHRRHSHDRADQISMEKYSLWRQEQKSRAAKLEQQLKSRWTLEDMIDEQLKRFHTHYNRSMVPTHLEDVAQILMPKGAPPLELASVGWLGDWRPSAILELLRSLILSSYLSFSSEDNSAETERILTQLIGEIRIEETVIDEEMAEIQATCILHLPFSPFNRATSPIGKVQSELKKIKQVITKAQQLRFKALELAVKKVLSQVDAAEFLVAFSGIQDVIHQYGARQKFQKSAVSVSVRALGNV